MTSAFHPLDSADPDPVVAAACFVTVDRWTLLHPDGPGQICRGSLARRASDEGGRRAADLPVGSGGQRIAWNVVFVVRRWGASSRPELVVGRFASGRRCWICRVLRYGRRFPRIESKIFTAGLMAGKISLMAGFSGCGSRGSFTRDRWGPWRCTSQMGVLGFGVFQARQVGVGFFPDVEE